MSNLFTPTEKNKYIEELKSFLRIPSISADPKYAKEVEKAAHFVADELNSIGCQKVKVHMTEGHPIVYGEKIVDSSLPTVLVYGHYDVQPPDPMELWDSEPFNPVIRKTEVHPEGAIFARGACDDKGQVYMHLKALQHLIVDGKLSCNVKVMIEGEEEVGSKSIETFIEEHKEILENDVILVSDTDILSNEQPSITTGLRGLSYVEVELTGPDKDLHSGLYGGAVANPLNELAKMITQLKDEHNKVTIPHFYDDVEEITTYEKEELTKVPFEQIDFQKEIGIKGVVGENGYSTLERITVRPTLDVNGMWGGYIGEGEKTVIPSKAFAKISMRLVPNQNWEKISQLFEDYFKSLASPGIQVKVTVRHGAIPYVTPIDTIAYKAAHNAYQESFGKPPIPLRGGGSIPIVPLFEKVFGSKTILMGFGLASDAIHSPNEHYGLFNFFKGIETIMLFYKHYSSLMKGVKG